MRFAFSLKRLVLAVIVGTVAELALMPSCAHAMVGDIPAMPQAEQTTIVTGNGSSPGGTTGSTLTGSGSPATTPEPPALLSGLLGLALLCAYHAICRGTIC